MAAAGWTAVVQFQFKPTVFDFPIQTKNFYFTEDATQTNTDGIDFFLNFSIK
jgi:hypothetical protein